MALRKLFTSLFALLMVSVAHAQSSDTKPDFNSLMRADGKVAVTIVIASLVLAGMVVLLINAERRLRKLEKEADTGDK